MNKKKNTTVSMRQCGRQSDTRIWSKYLDSFRYCLLVAFFLNWIINVRIQYSLLIQKVSFSTQTPVSQVTTVLHSLHTSLLKKKKID